MDPGLVNITRIMGVVGGRLRRQGTPPIILGPPIILSSHRPGVLYGRVGPCSMALCAVVSGMSGWNASSHHVAPAASYSPAGALAVHEAIATSKGSWLVRWRRTSLRSSVTASGGRAPMGTTPV